MVSLLNARDPITWSSSRITVYVRTISTASLSTQNLTRHIKLFWSLFVIWNDILVPAWETSNLIFVSSPSVSSASPAGWETLHYSLITYWSGYSCSNSQRLYLRLKLWVIGHQLPLNVTFALKLKISLLMKMPWAICRNIIAHCSNFIQQKYQQLGSFNKFHLQSSGLVIRLYTHQSFQ